LESKDLVCYLGKKIKIFLKENNTTTHKNFVYTCIIEDILDDAVKVKDKFNNLILIKFSDIRLITEVTIK